MSVQVTVRRAARSDATLLDRLEQLCALTPRSKDTLDDELASAGYAYFVAENVSEAVGYLGVGILAGEAHVMTVGVVPTMRRQHVARALLHHALHWCDTQGVTDVTLEVGARNTAAYALYETSGFVAEGVRPGYYANGDDAVIMWKRGN